jgi:hypothetical protein
MKPLSIIFIAFLIAGTGHTAVSALEKLAYANYMRSEK